MSQLTYNDHQIEQRVDNYVNLTQMAKANDARLNNYLASPETQKYLKALQESIRLESSLLTELVQTLGFGRNKATWGHPLVALHFGQWISPEFYVWCNQNIHTLVTTGSVSLQEQTTDLSKALLQTQQQLSQLTTLVTSLATGVQPTTTKQKNTQTRSQSPQSRNQGDYHPHQNSQASQSVLLPNQSKLSERLPGSLRAIQAPLQLRRLCRVRENWRKMQVHSDGERQPAQSLSSDGHSTS